MENKTKRDLALYNLVADYEEKCASGSVYLLKEQDFFQLITYYELERQIPKALNVVESALLQYRYRSEFYFIKARLLFQLNKYADSLEILDQAEVIAPFEFEIRILRVKVLASMGSMDEAFQIIEDLNCFATKSDKVDIFNCESFIHEWMCNYEAMFQSLKNALLLDPKNKEALERIWLSVEFSRNFEESILLHKLIIDGHPYNYLAWYNLGHAHACVGEYEEAINALEYSFIIEPDFELGYLDCAEFCLQQKQYTKALEIYEDSNQRFGPDADILMSIAQTQFHLNEYKKCKKSLIQSIRIDPYNDEGHYLLANCFIKSENWSRAMNCLNKAMYLDATREEYYHAMARIYINISDFENAKYYYKKAAKIGNEDPFYWEEYISFLIKISDIQLAEKELLLAEKCSYSDKLLYCKSIVCLQKNKKKEAILYLEEALLDNINNYQFFLDLYPEIKNDQDIISAINYYLGEAEINHI